MKRAIKEAFFIYSVGIVYIGAFLSLYFNYLRFAPYIIFQIVGVILLLSGLVLWILGFLSLGKYFYILPKPIGHTTNGIYKITSHPIYLGISLTFIGFSLTTGSGFGLLYSIFILSLFNYFRAKTEEKFIQKNPEQ